MAARSYLGSLRSPAATGTQAVTGVGFTPKALIVWSANTAISVPEFNDYAYWSFGMTDGTTHISLTSVGSDAFAPDMNQKSDTAALILAADTGGTNQHRATFTSFDADGFTIEWTAIYSSERRYYAFIALGGDDVSVDVGSFNSNTSTGQQAVTGVGFAPEALIFAPFQNSGTSLDETSLPALGWTDGTHQAAACVWSQDFGTVDTKRYQRTTKCAAIFNVATGAVLAEAGFVSLDADGFTVDWTTAPAAAIPVYYLAVKNLQMACGTLTQPTSTGQQTVSGAGFRPGVVALMSVNAASSASVQDHNDFTLSAASSSSAQAVWLADKDATATVQQARYYSQAYAYAAGSVAASGGSSTLLASATLASFTGGGFVLEWASVDSTEREILWMAFYDAYADDLDFDELDQQSGDVIGLTWVELYHKNSSGADTTYLWAPVDLTDASTYYGGYKEARLLGMGDINRGLSDRMGQYEAAEWSFTVSDTDRLIRGFFDRQATKHLLNRMVLARMIDDASRRALRRPRLLVRGLIRHYEPRGPLHFEFIARDHIASKFGPANLEKQIPQRLITRTDFPQAPAEVVGLPVPILYGQLGNQASATEPPVPVITASIGAFLSDRNPTGIMCGYAASSSAAAVPTGVTTGVAAGGTLPTSVANGEYGVIVTSVDSSGVESDPHVFYYDGNTVGRGSFSSAGSPLSPSYVETPDGTQKIQVSWSAAAGASKYRAYLCGFYYRAIFTQMLEVTAPTTSCEFTTGPDAEEPSTDNITPGATVPTFAVPWLYAVSAVMADGETALSKTFFNICVPYRRGNKIEWTAVPSALGYKVYRKHPDRAAWSQVRPISAGTTSYSDDLLNTGWTSIEGAPKPVGQVPTTYVGLLTPTTGGNPQHAFLVAGHACASIDDVYFGDTKVADANFGATWFVPGKTGYSTYWPNTGTTQYYDINGRRYTLIFVQGNDGAAAASGEKPITVNLSGIEDEGDSTGTVLTAITDIYRHAVKNWLFQSYESGAWLSAPAWPDDVDGTITSQVDETSFDTVADIHAARLSGGYPGAIAFGVNGESITLRDAVARLNLSADSQAGFNRNSQFFITAFDHRPAVATGAREYSQLHDITKDSFQIAPKTDEVENVVVYSYKRRYTGQANDWEFSEEEQRDEDAIADLQEERRSPLLALHGVRSSAVAQDIAQRRLALFKDPPQWVTFETNLKGLGSELGDTITVSHIGGTSASGWTDRTLRVMRHVTSPNQYKVRLECLDVARLYVAGAHDMPAGSLTSRDVLDASGWWQREPGMVEAEIVRPF